MRGNHYHSSETSCPPLIAHSDVPSPSQRQRTSTSDRLVVLIQSCYRLLQLEYAAVLSFCRQACRRDTKFRGFRLPCGVNLSPHRSSRGLPPIQAIRHVQIHAWVLSQNIP